MKKLNLTIAASLLASPAFAGLPSWAQGATPVPVDSPLALAGVSAALALVAIRVIRNSNK